MPVVNVYLSEELFEFVKKNKSKIIQQALKEHKQKQQQEKKHLSPPLSA
jgi:hypothetical protein